MNICPTEHKHAAVSTCYIIHKCRCDECRSEHAARERRRSRLKAYGRFDTGLVPAEPVRQHIIVLQQSGIGLKRIAELAGVGNTAVSQMIYGRKGSNSDARKGEVLKRVSREKAEKILAVQPALENMSAGALIDGRGVARRVQALAAVGWSLQRQGAFIGWTRSNMTRLIQDSLVEKSTHDKVCAMFDELWNKKPPMVSSYDRASYTRTVRHAKQMKWVPPLGWDDIDNDPSPAVVENEIIIDEFAIESLILGHQVKLSTAERKHAALLLIEKGKSVREVSEMIQTNPRVIERWRAA